MFNPTRDLLKNHAMITANIIAKYTSQLYRNRSGPSTGISDNTGISSPENAFFVTSVTATYPPACCPIYSPKKLPKPVPKIVSVSPVTFWFARSVIVRKL